MAVSGTKTASVLVDGGMHGREWVTVATSLQVVGQLVQMFNRIGGDDCEMVLTNIDWYVIPMLNPDGYEFSHTGDRCSISGMS